MQPWKAARLYFMALQFEGCEDQCVPLEWLVCLAWHRAGSFICCVSYGGTNLCLIKSLLASLKHVWLFPCRQVKDRGETLISGSLLSISRKPKFPIFFGNKSHWLYPSEFFLFRVSCSAKCWSDFSGVGGLVDEKAAFPAPWWCNRLHPPLTPHR